MWFGILGPTEVRLDDGRPVAVGGPRLRGLLAMLVLDAGKAVSVEWLIDGLYGAEAPDGVTNALQAQVSRLRQALRTGDRQGALVKSHPAGYRLAVEPDDVDAHRFQRLTAVGQRALATGDHPGAAGLLGEALALWRGPALADIGNVPFRQAQVVRLEELRLAAIEDRVEADLALGRHRELVTELRVLVAAHPLRERLHGQLMRALAGCGRQAEALVAFEDARRALAEALGADPSAELAAVHLAVLRADPAPAVAAPADASRRVLPAQLTSFVGRTAELRQVGKLLGQARLVTLTGPGGAGKTRLAIEAAGREPDDVCFVELAPLGDGADVVQAVLGALGLRDTGLTPGPHTPPPDATGRLVATLADQRMLLVLDSCEHVVEAAARLADELLGACPTLRVMATSREPLGITGETLCRVAPLALPPEEATAGDALGSPAVRLFADRAAAGQPDFAVDPTNVAAVVRVCRALDGLPLAIELAAARLRSLPVTEVAALLDARFRLLSRGGRTAPPRHQTLRAMVAWSWDLLDDTERVLARRLTVFSNGATLEAAARVCGLPPADVLDLLTSLADKSFVETIGDAESQPRQSPPSGPSGPRSERSFGPSGPRSDKPVRYRMLDTIRAFGAERLAAAGEEEPLRRAHAGYFLDLAQTADPYLRRAEQLGWLVRLAAEHDNLHAALRWAVGADPNLALELLAVLSNYWWLRGLYSGSGPLAGALLEALGPNPPGGLEEEYVLSVLNAVIGGADGLDLRAHLDTAQTLMSTLDPPPRRPFLALLWAVFVGPTRECSTPPMYGQNQPRPDLWIRALTHLGQGFTFRFAGEVDDAERELARALAGFRSLGERWGMTQSLAELATLADWRGDRARSIALTDEALDLAGQLHAMEDGADLLCRRADGRICVGDLFEAQADYERAAVFARQAGAPEALAQAHLGLGEIARLRGGLAEAREQYRRALAGCPSGWFTAELIRLRVRVALGRTAEADGDATGARTWYREVLAVALGSRYLPVAAAAAEGLAGVAMLEGDGPRAALLLGAGTALRSTSVAGDPDVARVAAGARRLIGAATYEWHYQRGVAMPRDEALTLLGVAQSAFGV